MNKICTKCGESKSLEKYHKDVSTKDGRRPDCNNCVNARNKQYKAKHKQQILEYNKSEKGKLAQSKYRKSDKGRLTVAKGLSRYFKTDKGKLALSRYNKSDKGRATIARKNHNKKIWKANSINIFNNKEFNCVIFLQNYRCAHCNRYFDEVDPARDHIKPASKGGDFIKENIQALCRSCNSKKSTKYIDYRTNIHKEMIRIL